MSGNARTCFGAAHYTPNGVLALLGVWWIAPKYGWASSISFEKKMNRAKGQTRKKNMACSTTYGPQMWIMSSV
jgi:hypothetical protein